MQNENDIFDIDYQWIDGIDAEIEELKFRV